MKTPARPAEPAPKTTRAKKAQPVKNAAAEPKAVVKTTEPKPARRPVKKIPAVTFSAGE